MLDITQFEEVILVPRQVKPDHWETHNRLQNIACKCNSTRLMRRFANSFSFRSRSAVAGAQTRRRP